MNESVKSMEQYFDERIAKSKFYSQLSAELHGLSKDRNFSRSEIRKLINVSDLLDINIDIFKENTSRYRVRPATKELFDYILFMNQNYGDKIVEKQFSDIPVENLIDLRMSLLHALYSAGLSEEQVRKEVQRFEKHTSCPAYVMPQIMSQLTCEAVEYLKNNCGYKLDCNEWEMLANVLEGIYRDMWRPKFIQLAHEKLMEVLVLRGYDIATLGCEEMDIGVFKPSDSDEYESREQNGCFVSADGRTGG